MSCPTMLRCALYEWHMDACGVLHDRAACSGTSQRWPLKAFGSPSSTTPRSRRPCSRTRPLPCCSDRGVDPHLIAWNHVVLLHGPPGRPQHGAPATEAPVAPRSLTRPPCAGTGKTSLCRALAAQALDSAGLPLPRRSGASPPPPRCDCAPLPRPPPLRSSSRSTRTSLSPASGGGASGAAASAAQRHTALPPPPCGAGGSQSRASS